MSFTKTLDPCAADCACLVAPAEFVRLRYFFAQRLGVIDFADEQSYLVGKQRFHNRLAHGVGVLCGLLAERYVFPQGSPAHLSTPATVEGEGEARDRRRNGDATTLLRVLRGTAFDDCGREIVVGWDQCIDVAAWFAQRLAVRTRRTDEHAAAAEHEERAAPARAEGPRLWVALCYRECPSDPAPAPRDPCGCEPGGCEFARIREGFELKLLSDVEVELLKKSNQDSRPVKLLVADEEPEHVAVAHGDSIAKAFARMAGAQCPDPPSDPCLLLASFTVTLDDAGKNVVAISEPDNTIPERLSLLSTSRLQQLVMHLMSAAVDAELSRQGPSYGAMKFAGDGADGGTLSIAVDTRGAELARDPFADPAQLTVYVNQFKADGSWSKAPDFKVSYHKDAPRHIELAWPSGAGLAEGNYRVSIENNLAQPAVDTKMRPFLSRWARSFRLVSKDGSLTLTDPIHA